MTDTVDFTVTDAKEDSNPLKQSTKSVYFSPQRRCEGLENEKIS
jgi:hypothetical protein